ncbi:MAG: GAF domain-containing protein [Lacunisphaera sp.]|jgi:signal transduction histidine kinase|nr:GAF domain-containing protein [Lacunisphaera sp.]
MADPNPQSAIRDPQSATDLAVLHAIASLASSAADAASAQRQILSIIMAAFPADSGSLALLSPETGGLEIGVQQGLPPDVGEFALKPGQGITGWVALHGQPLLVPDVAHEPRYISARAGVRCEMAAPLSADGHTLGVVNLDADRLGAFTDADLARLTRYAAEAGTVLHRLWQYERLRAHSQQLTTLVELGHALVTQLAPEELLSTLTQSGRALFNARLCLLHDYDGERRELRLHAWSADGDLSAKGLSLQQQAVPADMSLLAAAIRSDRATEFQHIDGPGYSEAADLPRDRSLCSALAVPLILEGRPAGVLSVFHGAPHRFSDDEKRLFTALASFAAGALQNARLYARVFRTEEVLRKSETLTTLGLLTAEIAHEIRNPLLVIKLLHGTLGTDFAANDPRRRDLQVITEKIDQLEGLASRVLSFGRAPTALHSPWALAEILDDTFVLLRAKLAQAGVELHYPAPDPGLRVEANKGQLQQVILNLAFNSLSAMPHGGRLTVTCAGEATAHGRVVLVDLADTGTGIPESIRARVFESFLSGRGDGTGLGLAIAARIMKDHRGELAILRTGPLGTTMRLTLPLTSG